MSGLVIAALIVTCAWLAVLTLVQVLIIRQIALLTVRTSGAGRAAPPVEDGFSFKDDGPQVGSSIPDEVASTLPSLRRGRESLLLLSATCAPCRELAADLSKSRVRLSGVALVPGSTDLADALVDLLPPGLRVLRDPEATRLANALQIRSTPFAITTNEGRVSGKSYISSKDDLLELTKGLREPYSEADPNFPPHPEEIKTHAR